MLCGLHRERGSGERGQACRAWRCQRTAENGGGILAALKYSIDRLSSLHSAPLPSRIASLTSTISLPICAQPKQARAPTKHLCIAYMCDWQVVRDICGHCGGTASLRCQLVNCGQGALCQGISYVPLERRSLDWCHWCRMWIQGVRAPRRCKQ